MHPRNLIVCALFAGPVLAQEGTWILEGSDSRQERFSAVLSVQKGPGGKLSFERSWIPLEVEDDVPPEVWCSSQVVVDEDDGTIQVTYEGADGVTGALRTEDDQLGYRVEASYAFTADGKRVVERTKPRPKDAAKWKWTLAQGVRSEPELVLEKENRLDFLLGDELERYEASGVAVAHGKIHVALDNSTKVAVLGPGLTRQGARLEKTDGNGQSDFEGLAYDAVHDRFYAVVEAAKHGDEDEARIWELTGDLELRRKTWSGLEVPSSNKGIEGLAFLAHEGEDYLLCLWEGNHGKAGKRSRERGFGQIEVLRRRNDADKGWRHEATMMLPEKAKFFDYSGLDLDGNRLAVVSQSSSQVWVGRLSGSKWEVADEGKVYAFPRERSRTLWAAVEGVAWLDAKRLVVVSDRFEGRPLAEPHDQSVAIFSLPE